MGLIHKITSEKNVQSLATSILVAAINLITFVLLVRTLGKEEFGKWVIFVTAASLADLIRFGITRRALIHFISGYQATQADRFKASGFLLDLIIGIVMALLIFFIHLLFSDMLGLYRLFFKYYPLLILTGLVWNNAFSIQQAQQNFDRIMLIRLLFNIPFFLFVIIDYYTRQWYTEQVIMVFIVLNLVPSVWTLIRGWSGAQLIMKSDFESLKRLFNYGKFTVLTSTGSSLLKSADTLIIGLSPILGAKGVAIYSIAFKIIDLIQIPLNAFIATASPKLSKAYINQKIDDFRNTLFTYTGAVSMLFIPVVVTAALLSKYVLLFFAGTDFTDDLPVMTHIYLIVLAYGLMMPLDRFTGVALDSAEMPSKNALKVYIMLFLNLSGNALAVFIFKSLPMVAAVSVIFTLTGIILGWWFLIRKLRLNPLGIISAGSDFYKFFFNRIKSSLQHVHTGS
ncbi:MAG: hypothetical protein Kow00127_09760 [Bacteroidales bacterium]